MTPRDSVFRLEHLPNEEDALELVIQVVRRAAARPSADPRDRCNFSLRTLIHQRIREEHRDALERLRVEGARQNPEFRWTDALNPFLEAAFELVRRGILMPGHRRDQHHEDELYDLDTFFLTTKGQRWAADALPIEAVPFQSDRFLAHLLEHAARFGDIYARRCREALTAYRFQLYLSSLTMAGGAAEAVLVAIGVSKAGDRERLEAKIRPRQRRTLLEYVVDGHRAEVREALTLYGSVMKYWRDDAAHANEAELDESHAYTSLLSLLRLAQYVNERWDTVALADPAL